MKHRVFNSITKYESTSNYSIQIYLIGKFIRFVTNFKNRENFTSIFFNF